MVGFKRFVLFCTSLILILFGVYQMKTSVENAKELTFQYIQMHGGSLDLVTAGIITEGFIFSNYVLGGLSLLLAVFVLFVAYRLF